MSAPCKDCRKPDPDVTLGPDWYFASHANQKALDRVCQAWSGTPWLANHGKRGVGVDCIRFVAAVLEDSGAIDRVTWPDYVTRRGGVDMLAIFLEAMDAQPKLRCLWRGPLPLASCPKVMVGDVLITSTGRAMHHAGIYAGNNVVWHSLIGRGVVPGNLHDRLFQDLRCALYRANVAPKQQAL